MTTDPRLADETQGDWQPPTLEERLGDWLDAKLARERVEADLAGVGPIRIDGPKPLDLRSGELTILATAWDADGEHNLPPEIVISVVHTVPPRPAVVGGLPFSIAEANGSRRLAFTDHRGQIVLEGEATGERVLRFVPPPNVLHLQREGGVSTPPLRIAAGYSSGLSHGARGASPRWQLANELGTVRSSIRRVGEERWFLRVEIDRDPAPLEDAFAGIAMAGGLAAYELFDEAGYAIETGCLGLYTAGGITAVGQAVLAREVIARLDVERTIVRPVPLAELADSRGAERAAILDGLRDSYRRSDHDVSRRVLAAAFRELGGDPSELPSHGFES